MRTTHKKIGGAIGVLVLSIASMVFGVATSANATVRGSEYGFSIDGCYATWRTAAVADRDLQDSDVVTYDGRQFTNLMTDLDGQPVDWTNGGYLYEVSSALDPTAPGWMEMQHFTPGGDNLDNGTTLMSWSVPVGADKAVRNGTLVIELPAGSTNIQVSNDKPRYDLYAGRNPGSKWDRYDWLPDRDPTVNVPHFPDYTISGTTITINNVNLEVGRGLAVRIDADQPTPDTFSNTNIGSAVLHTQMDAGAYPEGCPDVTPGIHESAACTFDWTADAIQMVSGSGTGMSNVHRTEAVSPTLGDARGKLGVDGWGGPGDKDATFFTRLIYTTIDPVENGTVTFKLDPRFQTDPSKFELMNPIPDGLQYRVDGEFPNSVEITDTKWDAATNTITYTFNAPAWSGFGVMVQSAVPMDQYVEGAQFTSNAHASGVWAVDPNSPSCPPDPQLALSKNVKDSDAPLGVFTEGEALTYQFVVTNTGNLPLSDVKVVDARLGDTAIDCVPALAVGQTLVCSAPYTATADDAAAGEIQNTATAVGVAAKTGKTVISNQDTATIPAKENVTETSTVTSTTTETETTTTTATSTSTATETATSTSTATETATTTSTATSTDTSTATVTTTSTAVECGCTTATSTSEVPVTMTVTETSEVPTTVTETITTEVPTTVTSTSVVPTSDPGTVTETVTETETTTRTVDVGAETGERPGGSLDLGSLGGLGSLGDTGSGSSSDAGSSVPTESDSADGSLGQLGAGSLGTLGAGSLSGGSSTGSLALGSLGLGALGIGGLIWAIQNHLIVLPAGLALPPLPGIDWGSLIPAPAPAPTEPAPQAPGPVVDNGRG